MNADRKKIENITLWDFRDTIGNRRRKKQHQLFFLLIINFHYCGLWSQGGATDSLTFVCLSWCDTVLSPLQGIVTHALYIVIDLNVSFIY